jgi:protein TonB
LVTFTPKPTTNDSTIFWAVVLSIALHILIAYVIPGIDFSKLESKMTMTVELASPTPTPPEPVVTPQPLQEIPSPQIKKPEPLVKPDIRPKLPPMPSAISVPSATTAPQNEAKPQATTIETSESKEEPKPAATTPANLEQAKPVAPTSQDISDARNQYGNLLTRHIGKFKQYPRIAQMRNWEGDVVLQLELDANGNLTSSQIYKSSGVEILDKQALEMVSKAAPFPTAPASLRGRSFNILVPVAFRLE